MEADDLSAIESVGRVMIQRYKIRHLGSQSRRLIWLEKSVVAKDKRNAGGGDHSRPIVLRAAFH